MNQPLTGNLTGNLTGMNANTGRFLSGDAHLVQSLRDILTTPKGSRVLRRGYGCDLPSFVGSPMNDILRMTIIAEVADALDRYEPRIKLDRVRVISDAADYSAGTLRLALDYRRQADGQAEQMEIHL